MCKMLTQNNGPKQDVQLKEREKRSEGSMENRVKQNNKTTGSANKSQQTVRKSHIT